ncbi:hypothetical protein [Nocardia nepalensis]|uniref:hypothetical protein n=1 Tax=Nocardia nepalensis TaxID=3375448 RepID=UPI003B685689
MPSATCVTVDATWPGSAVGMTVAMATAKNVLGGQSPLTSLTADQQETLDDLLHAMGAARTLV